MDNDTDTMKDVYLTRKQREAYDSLRRDAERYRELRRLFDKTKTSEAERVLADLGIPGEPCDNFDDLIDAAMNGANV